MWGFWLWPWMLPVTPPAAAKLAGRPFSLEAQLATDWRAAQAAGDVQSATKLCRYAALAGILEARVATLTMTIEEIGRNEREDAEAAENRAPIYPDAPEVVQAELTASELDTLIALATNVERLAPHRALRALRRMHDASDGGAA